jgi:hypothetical protein
VGVLAEFASNGVASPGATRVARGSFDFVNDFALLLTYEMGGELLSLTPT